MKLSVAICTRNRPNSLLKLLKQISVQTRLPDEVVLIENVCEARSFNLGKLRKLFPKTVSVQYITTRRKTIGASRNIVLEKVKGEIVLSIDDDVRVAPNLIEKILLLHQKFPNATGFVGKVLSLYSDPFSVFSSFIFNRELLFAKRKAVVTGFSFSTISLKVKDLKSAKLQFNELLPAGEDIIFLNQLSKLGYVVFFTPTIETQHDFLRGDFFNFFVRFRNYGKTLAKIDAILPGYLTEVKDSMPRKRIHWLFLPLYMLFKPFHQALYMQRHSHLKVSLFIPNVAYHYVYFYSIFFSDEGKALLFHSFRVTFLIKSL